MKPSFSTNSTAPKRSSGPCNYPHLWPAQGRLDLRLRAMLEPGKITRSGGTSKGSAQKDTLLREASKALIRQGKMWVIARERGRPEHRRRDEEGARDARAREHQEHGGERQAHERAEGPEQGLRGRR